jgi:hypothetical protein
MIVCGAFNQNMTWLEFLWCDFNRHKLGGVAQKARARTSLDLHQPRDAEALRATQHA